MALTHEQKLARNALAEDIRRRRPGTSYVAAITEASRAIRRSPAAAADVTAIAEAAVAAHQAARKARKAGKRRLRETLTAAGAPKPPPGTGQAPAQPAGRPAAPAKPLQEMSHEELTAATGTLAAQGASPFWRQAAVESAARGAVTETAPPRPGKPLDQMGIEEFGDYAAASLNVYGAAAGMRSPLWKGIADA